MQQADDSRRHQSSTRKRREPTRTRKRSWNHFLDVLAGSGNVSMASRAAGVPRRTAYRRRERNAGFRQQWDDAVETAVDALEQEARRRAIEGVPKVVFDRDGNVVTVMRQYSDPLLELLLRAHAPGKYGSRPGQERPTRSSVTWHFDGPQDRSPSQGETGQERRRI